MLACRDELSLVRIWAINLFLLFVGAKEQNWCFTGYLFLISHSLEIDDKLPYEEIKLYKCVLLKIKSSSAT